MCTAFAVPLNISITALNNRISRFTHFSILRVISERSILLVFLGFYFLLIKVTDIVKAKVRKHYAITGKG